MFLRSDGRTKISIVVKREWNLFSTDRSNRGGKCRVNLKIDLASLCNFPTMPTISIVDCFPVGAERDVVDFRLDRLQRSKLTTHTCFSVFLLRICLYLTVFQTRKVSRSVNCSVSFFRIYFTANDPIGVYLHLCPPDDPITCVCNASSVTE